MKNSSFSATVSRVFYCSDSQSPFCRISPSVRLRIRQSRMHALISAPDLQDSDRLPNPSILRERFKKKKLAQRFKAKFNIELRSIDVLY